MPGSTRTTRSGAQSKVITTNMKNIVCALVVTEDSRRVAALLGISRENISMVVRLVERKLGRRLFERKRGAGNTRWIPLRTQDEFLRLAA